jgi:hypothetical protein
MDDVEQQLRKVLKSFADNRSHEWMGGALARVSLNGQTEPMAELESAFTSARRALGTDSVPDGTEIIAGPQRVALRGWVVSDVGRALLLVIATRHRSPPALVSALFRLGDESERVSIVRALGLLPDGPGLKAVALEAGRVNSVALFSALALDNAYPAQHYTDHEFNQLVLKAMFMGQPIGRIAGLDARANSDLSRMSEDFYDERTAAGRPAPVDIWLALVPHASPRGIELAKQHVSHADPGHRFHAALALGSAAERLPELRGLLEERLLRETDDRVRRALNHYDGRGLERPRI